MPPTGGRKKPFSTKQKKKQLQDKRERKRDKEESGCWGGRSHHSEHGHSRRRGCKRSQDRMPTTHSSGSDREDDTHVETQPGVTRAMTAQGYDPNRFRLMFQRDSKSEIQQRKESARQPFTMLPEVALEMDIDELYRPGSALDMPKRPPWDYKMSREQVQAREEKYFKEYVNTLFEKYGSQDLSYLELNLETWQQLWRVLEMADIVLLIIDIRHPALHFSPALYRYVTTELNKSLILVLNKIDLAPPALVIAWRSFFHEHFPHVHIVCFTSFPKDKAQVEDPSKVVHKRRRKGEFTAVGPKQLLEACEKIVHGKVDLSSWRWKIEGDLAGGVENGEASHVMLEDANGAFYEHHQYKDGVLTIGCCGYPNVGKSSLMNGLKGHKVVSVSKTPGHTKHFQTIFLTPQVKLCDSPGLVFPSLIPKSLQVLAGIYPIAQVREPYTAVGFLAERIDLPRLLHLRHPEDECREDQVTAVVPAWSAYDICDAWATKRGFLTAKAARSDSFRAANHLLRLALDGRICLCMRPPGFTAKKDEWESKPETMDIARLQEAHRHANRHSDSDDDTGLHIPDSDEEFEKMMSQRHDEDKDINEAEGETSDEEVEDEGEWNEEEDDEDDEVGVSTNNPFSLLTATD